jgi:serine/threonine protein kinase
MPLDGTLRWQAPEIISGESVMTPEVDVYAFAIVCVEILTNGDLPWAMLDDQAVQQIVLRKGTLDFRDILPVLTIPSRQATTSAPKFRFVRRRRSGWLR